MNQNEESKKLKEEAVARLREERQELSNQESFLAQMHNRRYNFIQQGFPTYQLDAIIDMWKASAQSTRIRIETLEELIGSE